MEFLDTIVKAFKDTPILVMMALSFAWSLIAGHPGVGIILGIFSYLILFALGFFVFLLFGEIVSVI